jgi:hypothetical protein
MIINKPRFGIGIGLLVGWIITIFTARPYSDFDRFYLTLCFLFSLLLLALAFETKGEK